MTEFIRFGDPSRFEVAMRWASDYEPRVRRPAHGGWSTGELRVTVGNLVLTRHEFTGNDRDAVHWYLFPFSSGWRRIGCRCCMRNALLGGIITLYRQLPPCLWRYAD